MKHQQVAVKAVFIHESKGSRSVRRCRPSTGEHLVAGDGAQEGDPPALHPRP